MDNSVRKKLEGWREKAQKQMRIAEDCLKRREYSESVESSQESIEFSVKTILSILNIEFPTSHEWKPESKPFEKIALQIKDRKIVEKIEDAHLYNLRLPRLLFIFNFWGQFNTIAKYGYEKGDLAAARDLFIDDDEAKLASKHANDCYLALTSVFYLPQDQLDKISGEVQQ
jgi:hypothetical protein